MPLSAAAAATALVLTGCTASSPSADPLAPTILMSVDSCGSGWETPTAGPERFTISNVDARAGEIYLTDAATGAVYADLDPLGPGTTAELDATLGPGSYAFRCAMEDSPTVTGSPVTVGGTPSPTPSPVAAVSQADLIPATRQYEQYVAGRIPELVRLCGRLRADLHAGDLDTARADWLPAHLEYERLGAAYGAFGDLDGEINGVPSGLPQGTADPSWTGFHRIEHGLWHGEDAASLAAAADELSDAVGRLGDEFAHAQIDPLQLSLRAHEITENALQFELTGKTDFGSHSNLATIAANVDGTTTVLDILQPLLVSRDPELPRIRALVQKTRDDLAAAGTDLGSLPRATREGLDADLSELAEELAPVASLLEPRRVNQ